MTDRDYLRRTSRKANTRAAQVRCEPLEPRTLLSVAGLTVAHGYNVSVFATNPTGSSQPDSICVDGAHLFVGYQNGGAPDGSGGAMSTIVEYSVTGSVLHSWSVAGHNDGLKIDPSTHLLWAMQNEDASPGLTIIDPVAITQTAYTFAAAPLAGGGYDDITFLGGKVYFSSSNPANNPNTGPAIVQATFNGTVVSVSTVLLGNASATEKHKHVTLNLQDPDSMTANPSGDLVMTSQADNELVVVKNPATAAQSTTIIPLVGAKHAAVSVDDTLFPPTGTGEILLTDTKAGTIYAITGKLPKNAAFSAAPAGMLGMTNLKTGKFTPVISGLQGPHGLAFLPFGLTVARGYTVLPFISSPVGSSQPDSICFDGTHVYVGYQNGGAPDGSGGAMSTIAEYDSSSGALLHSWTVAGHNDGLKVDPATHLLWAMQNEDANPGLTIIDPVANTQTAYTFAAAPLAGGGYDDITFLGGKVYFSSSNPANNPNTGPAIVQASLSGTVVSVTTILLGNASAPQGHKTVTLNLQDPDSMTADPAGDLVMTSQADDELVIVKNPGASNQSVRLLPLTDSKHKGVSVDDTLFAAPGTGTILVSDTKAGIVYSISGKFSKNLILSADASTGVVGKTDIKTGRFTPLITGFAAPHGLTQVLPFIGIV